MSEETVTVWHNIKPGWRLWPEGVPVPEDTGGMDVVEVPLTDPRAQDALADERDRMRWALDEIATKHGNAQGDSMIDLARWARGLPQPDWVEQKIERRYIAASCERCGGTGVEQLDPVTQEKAGQRERRCPDCQLREDADG